MTERLVLGASLTLAGAGAGIVAALATSAGWARTAGGVVGAVAGLAAAVWIDRSVERRAALRARASVLDPVTTEPGHDDSVFGVLLATRAIAPFRGRAADLAWLNHWCDDPEAHPVAVITGPVGTGKTRLVTEFATRRPAPWAAGWLHPDRGGQALAAAHACGDPALILVDDADEQPDLIALLQDLAARPDGPPVRVVMISRATDPRPEIASRLSEAHRWIVASAPVRQVGFFGSNDDHARWFAEAARAYAAARHTPPPDLSTPISRPAAPTVPAAHILNEPVLTVHAQALLAVLDTERRRPLAVKTQDLPFEQVAGALFTHEQARWQQAARQPQWGLTAEFTPPVQERAIAVLALTTTGDQDQAIVALRQVPDLADAPTLLLTNIARWAAHLYPSDPPCPLRIQPAMLAEWFLVTQLTGTPQLAHNLTHQASAHAQALLVPLAHASDNLPAAAQLFAEIITSNITSLLPAGITAALTASKGQPLLDRVLASLTAQASWTAEALTELDHQLPEGLLPYTQAAVTAAHIEHLRASGTPLQLARALDSLGACLRDLGRHQEALTVAEEALSLRRELAAADPAYRPQLAMALNNLGAHLRDLGRPEEALTMAEEALSLYRELATANPAHRSGLASTLNNLGAHLHGLGRPEEALTMAEEALSLYRELATANPAHRSGLANTLINLGASLSDLGRAQEALTATEEALSLRRDLAAANPIYRPDLAGTLINLGASLSDLGRQKEALTATEEAVSLFRELAAANPAHRPNLAMALNNLGNRMHDLGRPEEALAMAEEAVGLYRELAAANPAYRPNLAMALNNLGADLGRPEEALAMAEEAVGLYRELAAANPAYRPNLASTLNNLGAHLRNLGRPEEALTADREAVKIYRELAEKDPGLYEKTYQRVLARLRLQLDRAGDTAASIQLHLRDDGPPGGQPPQSPPAPAPTNP